MPWLKRTTPADRVEQRFRFPANAKDEPMTRSAPETLDLEQQRDRAPRHWLQRLVRRSFPSLFDRINTINRIRSPKSCESGQSCQYAPGLDCRGLDQRALCRRTTEVRHGAAKTPDIEQERPRAVACTGLVRQWLRHFLHHSRTKGASTHQPRPSAWELGPPNPHGGAGSVPENRRLWPKCCILRD
jgi:hypothetical protein